MNGWLSFSMIILSLIIGFIFCSRDNLSFLIIFMAYNLPVSFFLTRMTLLNAPLPITLICSKSCLVTLKLVHAFWVNVSFAKCALRNSPFSKTCKGLHNTYLEIFKLTCCIELANNLSFRACREFWGQRWTFFLVLHADL